MYDVIIIGAGVIGTSIARELSKYSLKILVVDRENDISNETTKANSAIIHAGYDARPGSLKAKFNVEGNPMFDKLCRDLDVPFKRIGSLVVAFNEKEMETLKEIYKRGLKNGVKNMKIINRSQLIKREPNIAKEAIGVLYAPSAGIIGPWEFALGLMENAISNGAELALNTEVLDIKKLEKTYKLITNKGELSTRYLVNAAGIYADRIHNMVSKKKIHISPRRGQYFLLDKSAGKLVTSIIFQTPTKLGKGVLVLPTVHGNLLVGPDAEFISDKEATETTDEGLKFLREKSERAVKNIPFNEVIRSFSGLRATPEKKDFIIGEVEDARGFIDVAGIESPGLSASPAIGRHVVEILKNIDGKFTEREDFNPENPPRLRLMDLSDEEKRKLIKKDPSYGRIICRCEHISEGEIIDAIERNPGARTVDGVKKRVRPGSGRCQGGFCKPRVMEILSRELDIDFIQVVKDGPGSNIALFRTEKGIKDKGGDDFDAKL